MSLYVTQTVRRVNGDRLGAARDGTSARPSTSTVEIAREAVSSACPVCRAPAPQRFLSIRGRDYWRCGTCEARFIDPRQRPTRQDEYAHYLHHENDPDDPRYRRFLAKLVDPLRARLRPGLSGLDYGCGARPALVAMLREAGQDVALYDPFFHPDPAPLQRSYDFITCTEVAEHFHRPADEFDRLGQMLKPGGWLAVMTCFQTVDSRFADWRYRRDPTHVVFYREASLRMIAAQRGWACEIPVKDVALMHKPGGRIATG
jgi:ribosomal protein L37AE/L43A